MKNMRKRILSLMVVLMMSLSLVQPTAFAAYDGEEPDTNSEPIINVVTTSSDVTPPADSEAALPAAEEKDSSETTEVQESNGNVEGEDAEDTSKPVKVPDFPVDGTEEEQENWYQDYVDRPDQSETVDTSTGTVSDIPNEPTKDDSTEGDTTEPAAAPNWSVFWNEETKSYELTYEIAEDAEGDLTIDLTNALRLLNGYAQDAEKVEKPVAPEKDFSKPGLSEEDQAKLDAYEKEMETWDEDYAFICKKVAEMNSQLYLETHTMEQIVHEFNTNPYRGWYGLAPSVQASIPVKPDVEEVDEDSPEYKAALAEYEEKLAEYEVLYAQYENALENYNRQKNANVLQPGDIRNFAIYITTKSGHTYKYKDGSFTLATPELGESSTGVTGFDGQELGTGANGHISVAQEYNVSAAMVPFQHLLLEVGVPEPVMQRELKAGHNNFAEILEYLADADPSYADAVIEALGVDYTSEKIGYATVYSYDNQALTSAVKAYLVNYYSDLDGVTYADLDDVFARSINARSDVSSTENVTQAEKGFTFSDEKITASYGQNFEFNNFYQSLLSFVYGDAADIEKLLGGENGINDSNHPQYVNSNWSSGWNDKGLELDFSVVLEQYMSHQTAWDQANEYFKELLKEGLSAREATVAAFTMAVNLDGELTSNNWQLTKWGWYNSIQLEQMDIDFSLTKKDGETGETITSSETGFQVYYIDKVKGEDGNETSVNMYCTYNEETQSYTFTATPSTVWTENGELKIDYALMKDIVYYLQETVAPDGYEKDPNVYIVMNEDDYSKLSDEAKANLEGTFDKFLDLTVENGGLSVSTDFFNVKIVTTPDRPTPTPTPDPDPDEPDIPDPDVPLVPGPDPEEPPVDIPDENPPLVDIPEEEPPLVDVPDLEVPLAPRPSTPTKPTPKPPVTTVEVDIPDEEVPLADVPNTGDDTGLWCALGLAAGAGLAYLFLEEKKRQNSAR